jgi:hypothetical protein
MGSDQPLDIRALAEAYREVRRRCEAGGPIFMEDVRGVDPAPLADFALAVLDAMDERAAASATASDRYHDGFSSGVGMTWEARRLELEAIRAAIARNMEEARRGG